jgi:modulator of FtsH protease HflC
MDKMGCLLVIVAAIVAVVGLASTMVVSENEQVVITQFGAPVGDAVTEPGLYFKVPFIQRIHRFDNRYLEWSGARNQIPTRDKRFIWVDTFARWRIVDPLRFYQRVLDEQGAQSRLDDIIDGATRDVVANHDLIEVVRSTNRVPAEDPELYDIAEEIELDSELVDQHVQSGLADISRGRGDIMEAILVQAAARAEDLGIEILDVRFKHIHYNQDVQQEVFARMIAERQRIAQQYRSEGEGEAAKIRGEMERELQRLESDAYRRAEEIRGRADAHAAGVYAEAFDVDPEFYRFLRTMETYGEVLDANTTLILTTESDFFEFLKSAGD